METSIIGMPVLFLFGMSSMFKSMIENEFILKMINYLPNEQLDMIWEGLGDGESFSGIIENILILLVWVVISVVATTVIYQRHRID